MRVIDEDRSAADVADALEPAGSALRNCKALKTASASLPVAMQSPAATSALEIWKSPGSGRTTRRPAPPNSSSSVEDIASRETETSRIVSPFAPTEKTARPRASAAATTRGAMSLSASTIAGRAVGQQFAKEAKFGAQVILDGRVVVHMIARQVGERAGPQSHAVEPPLIEAVRRRLQRDMGYAGPGELLEGLMQRDRVGRGQGPIGRHRARHDADRADRGGFAAERSPDLADEGGDRGLAAGSRDCDDGLRAGADRCARRHAPGRPARRRP